MIKCPVCGKYEFLQKDDFDICPVCGWENDAMQRLNEEYFGGANELPLVEYRAEWEATKSSLNGSSSSCTT